MKKIFVFLLSFFVFISCFSFMNINGYAITIEPQNNGFQNAVLKYRNYASSTPYEAEYDINANSQYNRYGICCYFYGWTSQTYHTETWYFINVLDLINGFTNEEPIAYVDYSLTAISNGNLLSSNQQTWVTNSSFPDGHPVSGINTGNDQYGDFTVDFPVFNSKQSAIDFYRYNILDEDSVRYGERYLEDYVNIEWEDGNPYYGSYSEDIPAPKWNVTGSQSGNISKTITFTNAEFDPRSQNGRYGIVLSLKWGSVDDFVLNHSGGFYSKDYSVYYNSQMSMGNLTDIYSVPVYQGEIQYCPQSFMFTQDTKSLNAFNLFLSNNQVANRSITVPNDMVDTALSETFQNYLSNPNCPYNTLIFTCCYYKKLSNGKYAFGPYSTGTFNPPSQGAIFSVGSLTSTDQGGMTYGSGGGSSGSSENGSWDQSWGNNTPDINYGQNADPQQLIDNVNGLFGLVGQVPSFVAQLVSFLPDWILQFIAVSLGLAIAIGVVKLFIG